MLRAGDLRLQIASATEITVPSRNADEELVGIGSALGAVGAGAFGVNSDFDDKAHELRGWSGLVRSPSGWVPKSVVWSPAC